MATNTYVAIDTRTITSAVATMDFTSIPATYTDLVIITSAKNLVADNAIYMTFNGDSAANYSNALMYGSGGGSTGSGFGQNQNYCIIGRTNTTEFNVGITHIQNYANSTTNKTVLSRGGNTGSYVLAYANQWRNSSSPINRITLTSGSGNFEVGSSATIYGIASSNIGAPKAFGGTITQDATHTYHTFGASGTFTPQQSLTADILVVAGGGGSAYGSGGGGGGAGGLLTYTSQSLTATGYTITVGAGGATPTTGAIGSAGGNSQFGSLTASVGGGYGGFRSTNGGNGGSGGGAGSINTTQTGGTGTSGQGNAGGNSVSNGFCVAGGGGAGAAGASATSSKAGDGGIGATSALLSAMGAATGTGQSSGNDYYYAGGGGGGSASSPSGATLIGGVGGLGGGGRGGFVTGETGTAGLALTGGGGGSGHTSAVDTAGGKGGSGVVIIRYAN